MDVEAHIQAAKELFRTQKKHEKTQRKEQLHSLPISSEERAKREHEAAEHKRFEDAFGQYKITRNAAHYITQIRKQVEDIVVERNYTRDEDNYITAVETKLKIERKA